MTLLEQAPATTDPGIEPSAIERRADRVGPARPAGSIDATNDDTGPTVLGPTLSVVRRSIGTVLLVVAVATGAVWLAWRVTDLPLHPVAFAVLLAEAAGLVSTVAIAVGLRDAVAPRQVFVDDPREAHRFAFAVADIVGRTRSTDVHRDVRSALRTVRDRRTRRSADVAMAAVLAEGPRRLLIVAGVAVGAVTGMAPMHLPPVGVLVVLAVSVAAAGGAHVALGGGRIRFGDRVRWSYASMGEAVSPEDGDGIAPRRWVGTVAALVVASLAVALRGMSDRWTHGLPPMAGEDRAVVSVLATLIVVGALFTMRTIEAPTADDLGRARRHEERTARSSAVGAAVVIGLIGLIAGVLPAGVDTADRDPHRIEHPVELEAGSVAR